MKILTVKHLSKKIKQKTIIKDISFEINQGEFLCITGQNGAGKTILLNLITGLIEPSSGTVEFWGKQKISQEIRKKLGIVCSNTRLFQYLTPFENIEFFCKIFDIKNYKEKISYFFNLFSLSSYLSNTKITMESISSGQNIKVGLVKALINNPKLLILDEPTAYLDKASKKQILQILKDYKKDKKITCLIVSHSQHLIKICDRVLTLSDGVFK